MSKKKLVSIFSGRESRYLAEKIANEFGIELGNTIVTEFSDGEFQPSFEENIRGRDVFIVQSTFAPTDNLFELLMMVESARRASARNIVAVIPYFGFARQDRKDKPRVSIAAKLVANLLAVAGVTRIITIDQPAVLVHHDQPVTVTIERDADIRLDRWAEQARAVAAAFAADLDPAITLDTVFDQSRYTGQRLGDLAGNLLASGPGLSEITFHVEDTSPEVVTTVPADGGVDATALTNLSGSLIAGIDRYRVISSEEIASLLEGEPRYRVDQLWNGLYRNLLDPADVTNLPAALRERMGLNDPLWRQYLTMLGDTAVAVNHDGTRALTGSSDRVLRLWDLGRPHAFVFDETYYAKQGLSLVRYGTEQQTVDGADEILLATRPSVGSADVFLDAWGAEYFASASRLLDVPVFDILAARPRIAPPD